MKASEKGVRLQETQVKNQPGVLGRMKTSRIASQKKVKIREKVAEQNLAGRRIGRKAGRNIKKYWK